MTAARRAGALRFSRAAAAVAGASMLLLQLASMLPHAAGHAVVIEPRSRPWLDYLEHYNYNPHAVFAGGTKAVSQGGSLTWPNTNKYSICGDATSERKWDVPGRVTGTYKSGQVIDVDVLFAQNHLGRMNVRVCPLDATEESKCTQLELADGRGKDFDLPWTPGWWGVTDGWTAPAKVDGFEAYKLPAIGKSEGCATWSCDMFRGMYVYKTKWQLPNGFTCEHCKLQMYYLTASRCWPPCNKADGSCVKPVGYKYCGEPGSTYPEQFWNCADIKIENGSGTSRSRRLQAHV